MANAAMAGSVPALEPNGFAIGRRAVHLAEKIDAAGVHDSGLFAKIVRCAIELLPSGKDLHRRLYTPYLPSMLLRVVLRIPPPIDSLEKDKS
jgi:hypothetical protein